MKIYTYTKNMLTRFLDEIFFINFKADGILEWYKVKKCKMPSRAYLLRYGKSIFSCLLNFMFVVTMDSVCKCLMCTRQNTFTKTAFIDKTIISRNLFQFDNILFQSGIYNILFKFCGK